MIRRLFKKQSQGTRALWSYIGEVSLIILSILIAIQADRYSQSMKNQAQLEEYLQLTYQDLLDEQFLNQNNLNDCQSDISDIQTCLRLCRYNQDDSLNQALSHLQRVFSRGVFRAFPPTTFDIMASNGDISLIQDLSFRKNLASVFSFRDAYVKQDLLDFDAQTKTLAYELGQYIDLECLSYSESLHTCLIDRPGFVEGVHNELVIFLRQAELRQFHLTIAVQYFERAINEIEQLYDLKK